MKTNQQAPPASLGTTVMAYNLRALGDPQPVQGNKTKGEGDKMILAVIGKVVVMSEDQQHQIEGGITIYAEGHQAIANIQSYTEKKHEGEIVVLKKIFEKSNEANPDAYSRSLTGNGDRVFELRASSEVSSFHSKTTMEEGGGTAAIKLNTPTHISSRDELAPMSTQHKFVDVPIYVWRLATNKKLLNKQAYNVVHVQTATGDLLEVMAHSETVSPVYQRVGAVGILVNTKLKVKMFYQIPHDSSMCTLMSIFVSDVQQVPSPGVWPENFLCALP
jgi:hypothetical protein